MVTLKDIFNVWYGVNLEVVNSNVVEKGIPFVSRQSVNNGVVCNVAPIEGVEPNPANTLSIAVSGSVLSTFYHDYEYYSGRDVYVAEPKEPMTKEEMLFYAYVIEQNKFRYNYGRGANRTFRDIVVPARNEVPRYIVEYPAVSKFINEPISNSQISIDTINWKWFFLKDIFKIKRGKRLTEYDRVEGNIPFITAGVGNNGLSGYISNDVDLYKNAITVDMFGCAFYRESIFSCDDNVLVLTNDKLNSKNGLFIASIIDRDKYKFAYGRQYRQKNFKSHQIKLPITPNGLPDWQFMEDYIKSLPYSKNLEPIDTEKLMGELLEYKRKNKSLEHQLQAQQSGSLVNYGTVNIYEK